MQANLRAKYPKLETIVDIAQLHDLFVGAAETMRYMPKPTAKRRTTYWPSFRAVDFLNYAAPGTVVTITPSTEQVTLWELAIHLTFDIPPQDRKLIWSCALSAARRRRGPAWKKLSKIFGCSAPTMRRWYEEALYALWVRL